MDNRVGVEKKKAACGISIMVRLGVLASHFHIFHFWILKCKEKTSLSPYFSENILTFARKRKFFIGKCSRSIAVSKLDIAFKYFSLWFLLSSFDPALIAVL